MPRENHYEVLALKPGATPEEIEDAYARAARKLQADPTKVGSDRIGVRAERARVEEAYSVLRDPVTRQEYDRLHNFGWGRRAARRRAMADKAVQMPMDGGATDERVRGAEPQPEPAARVRVDTTVTSVATTLSGADLRKLREQRGVTLEEIGSQTKLTTTLLQHIENDRHDRLPPPVYVRGFLQQYARAVGLDPRGTADAYMSRIPRPRKNA